MNLRPSSWWHTRSAYYLSGRNLISSFGDPGHQSKWLKMEMRRRLPHGLALIILAVLVGLPSDGWSNEQILSAKASSPTATVKLLTAPHTGKKLCDISDSTPLKFFNRAAHGPHKYAKVEVLEGTCAGKQGFVPLISLDPQPQTN